MNDIYDEEDGDNGDDGYEIETAPPADLLGGLGYEPDKPKKRQKISWWDNESKEEKKA